MMAVMSWTDVAYLEERVIQLYDLGGKDLGLRLASER
jgi:hypothetical protein